jgi:hypothetical protein
MSDTVIYVLLAGILLLAGFSSYRISKSVHLAVGKKVGSWAWAASIPAFILCLSVFTVAMGMVIGVFFGR